MKSNTPKIIAGRSNPELAKSLADKLGVDLLDITIKEFSSGELYINLEESVRGQDVYVMQTFNKGEVNNNLMELLLILDACRRGFASSINVIVPYLGYCRQDKIHEKREPVSAKLVANLIVEAGATSVITFNLHSDQTQGFFEVPLDNLSTKDLLIDKLKALDLSNPVLIAPDVGSAKMVKSYSTELDWPMAILHKSRPKHNTSEVNHIIGEVEGKTPVIIDDMVDTSGSVLAAVTALKSFGANDSMYLMATHPVLSGPAYERLDEAGFDKIIFTDTIPVESGRLDNMEIVSVAEYLASVISRRCNSESVNS